MASDGCCALQGSGVSDFVQKGLQNGLDLQAERTIVDWQIGVVEDVIKDRGGHA